MENIYICKGEKVFYENNECIIIRIIDVETVSIEEVLTHQIHTVHVNKLSSIQTNTPTRDIHSLSEKEWESVYLQTKVYQCS